MSISYPTSQEIASLAEDLTGGCAGMGLPFFGLCPLLEVHATSTPAADE